MVIFPLRLMRKISKRPFIMKLNGDYDVLRIYGYNTTIPLAIAAAKIHKIPLLIRTDSPLNSLLLQKKNIKNKIRKLLHKLVLKLFDGALAIGSSNAEYYRELGMRGDKIFLVPYTVDDKSFMSNNNWNKAEIHIVRRELGISIHKPVILFVGKLIPNKRTNAIIASFLTSKEDVPH